MDVAAAGEYAFLSHDHKSKPKVKLLATLLALAGVRVWYDTRDMKGDAVTSMTSGIDAAAVVIACITSSYIRKCNKQGNDNCKLELVYAYNRKQASNILVVVLDKECMDTSKWGGKVGAFLSSHFYYDMSTPTNMIMNGKKLVAELRSVTNKAKADNLDHNVSASSCPPCSLPPIDRRHTVTT